jgi:hypothetical protein
LATTTVGHHANRCYFDEDGYLHLNGGKIRLDENATRDIDSSNLPGRVVSCLTEAGTAHSDSTTETALASYTIPADTLKAGTVVKVRYQGIATATNSSDTLTIKLYLGGLSGTALLTGTATDVANNNIFAGEAMIVIRTAGASGTFVSVGTHTEVPAASGTAVHDVTEIVASTAIDTTATVAVAVGADWSVASASNSCRMDIFVVEIY